MSFSKNNGQVPPPSPNTATEFPRPKHIRTLSRTSSKSRKSQQLHNYQNLKEEEFDALGFLHEDDSDSSLSAGFSNTFNDNRRFHEAKGSKRSRSPPLVDPKAPMSPAANQRKPRNKGKGNLRDMSIFSSSAPAIGGRANAGPGSGSYKSIIHPPSSSQTVPKINSNPPRPPLANTKRQHRYYGSDNPYDTEPISVSPQNFRKHSRLDHEFG
ncbi:unnamed protein product [Ambrosiozyma monospora]|uniref:Unnamed protein product n=1 Tax=Ambrosiozyma monospora TaxID=43982 RepID=A0A9W6Z7X2_AMBMO|nr:unnamed protein product [Ambrosiozyma monospora]